jgi:uncharacterized iron-regulated membrane protein
MRPPSATAARPLARPLHAVAAATSEPELVEDVMIAAETPAAKRKRPIRTALFWLHLASGVIAGIVVFIMSLTGIFLAYEHQLLGWAASSHEIVAPAPGATRLPIDQVLATVNADPAQYRVTSMTIPRDSMAPIALGLESRQSIYADPYTGRVIGADGAMRAFMTWSMRWHRSLAMSAATRDPVGAQITGASNLLFLFMVLSGIVLWWPKQMTKRAFRAVAFFSPRAKGRARDWNWHHVFGVWAAIPLVFIVASATFISYRWPLTVLEKVTGSPPAPQRGEGGAAGRASASRESGTPGNADRAKDATARPSRPAGGSGGAAPAAAVLTGASLGVSADLIVHQARLAVQDWQTIAIRPGREGALPTVSATTGPFNRPSDRVALTLESTGGTLVAVRAPRPATTAARMRSWMRSIHTGEALGTAGQSIAALASVAGVLLAFTGLALVWRRFLRSVSRKMKVTARPA